jgi:hypothetical protein
MNMRWLCLILALALTSCATYRTPGAGVNVGQLSNADQDIADVMLRQPAAAYPSRIAVVRAQANGYASRGTQCYGQGPYCVVTAREIETEKDFQRISTLPMVAGVAPMSHILLPGQFNSLKDLRVAAAQLRADMLLLYSVDTRFNVESTDIGPLSLISLGFLPNKKAKVTTTAASALIDVRSGFLYGVAEATALEEQRATVWSSEDAIDKARVKAEVESFQLMLGEFEKLWKGVVEEHAGTVVHR